ncbi:MAG: hypothetical protein ACLPN6_09975, partial [Streptosporangiaceae bacterium]
MTILAPPLARPPATPRLRAAQAGRQVWLTGEARQLTPPPVITALAVPRAAEAGRQRARPGAALAEAGRQLAGSGRR